MERLMSATADRVEKIENEKAKVEADLDVKREVVEQSHEQIKAITNKMEESERELETMRKSLKDKEEFFSEETVKLRRKIEDEEYAKSSLERKLKGLEDELNSKMTEIAGLKTSVAELSSSRAGIEAALAGTKSELEAARRQVADLLKECAAKAEEIKAGLDRDVSLGVIEKLPVNTPTDWCARMVLVPKPNGNGVRRTIDFTALNKVSQRQLHNCQPSVDKK